MKIFISWSGARSKAVAEIMSIWIKCVLQASQPWISTRDIERGAIWFSEINDKLRDASVGIVCLTQDNKNKPWILFETGALAKGLSTNRVLTFLIDLQPTDLQDPLAQFNHTTPQKNSVRELVKTINSCLNEKMLDDRTLDQVFETYWPQFEKEFGDVILENPPTEDVQPRSEKDLLSEILSNTRGLSRRVLEIESTLMVDNLSKNKIYKSGNHMYDNSKNYNKYDSEADYMSKIMDSIRFEAPEEEVIRTLLDYGLPEDYIKIIIKKMKSKKTTCD